jgi:hypothetical protein
MEFNRSMSRRKNWYGMVRPPGWIVSELLRSAQSVHDWMELLGTAQSAGTFQWA